MTEQTTGQSQGAGWTQVILWTVGAIVAAIVVAYLIGVF